MKKLINLLFVLFILVGCTANTNQEESTEEITDEASAIALEVSDTDSNVEELSEDVISNEMLILEPNSLDKTTDLGIKTIRKISAVSNIEASTLETSSDNKTTTLSKTNNTKTSTSKSNSKKTSQTSSNTTSSTTTLDTSDWRIQLAYSYEGTVFMNCEYTAMKYLGEIGLWDGDEMAWLYRAYKKVNSPSFGTLIEYQGHVAVYLKDNMCLHGGWNGNNVKVASCTLGASQPVLNYYDTTTADDSTSNTVQVTTTTWDSNGNTTTTTKEITYEEYKNGSYKPHVHTFYNSDAYTFYYPTCTEDGYILQKCDTCGEITDDHYETTYGGNFKAKGHDYQNGVCTRCGASDPNYVAPHNHNYIYSESTETERIYVCECGDVYKETIYVPSVDTSTDTSSEVPTTEENAQTTNVENEVSSDTEVSE